MPAIRFTTAVANTPAGTERDCGRDEARFLVAAGVAELVEAPAEEAEAGAEVPTSEPTREDIRAWAIANGHECSPKGALPKSVIEAYRKAH